MQRDSQEVLVLAVLNTTPTVDGTRRDLLVGADGAAFVEHWGGGGEGSRHTLVQARDAVQVILATGAVDSKLSAVLTRQVVQRPRLGTDGLVWELKTPPHAALAIRFLNDWTRLATNYPGRLKRCADPHCSVFLFDRSNANARQWCSMTSCGNRMKARRHHRRIAQHGQNPGRGS